MKRLATIIFIVFSVYIFADEIQTTSHKINVGYSCISYNNVSVGYSYDQVTQNGFHGSGNSFGLQYQYQFENRKSIIRPFFNRYNWDIPTLIGISVPLDITNHKIGLAPHFGISFWGNLHLFYRYNFMITDYKSSFHELVLEINIPLVKNRKL
jgi:hypothetical protein